MARLRILDLAVSLRGPEETVCPILAAYRRFLDPSLDESECVPVAFGPSGEADPVFVGYARFLRTVIDGVGSHALLHAAAFAVPGGAATLLAAPAGYGKTTLALEMASRGLTFLGDDTAPLDLSTARITPFPRAVGVRPGGSAPVAEPFRAAANDPATPRLLGKALVDVESVLGRGSVAGEPVPMSRVLVLGEDGDASPPRVRIDVAVLDSGVAAFREALERSPGVRMLRSGTSAGITAFEIAADRGSLAASPLPAALEADPVVYNETRWSSPPRFDARPVTNPISRRSAATILARGMLNRRGRGRLMRRYRGDATALFLDIAAALRHARCFLVHPGRFRETADLVERLASDPAPD